jgi:hypothetical protein
MKTTPTLFAAAVLLLAAFPSQARNINSPDHKFAIKADSTIELVDSSGQTILVLSKNTVGAKRVEIAWSPDSSKVAMAEDFARGSAIFAAWFDGVAWHKTLQSDSDQAGIVSLAQGQLGGRLVSEERTFGGWISSDALQVKGSMAFSSGKRVPYEYVLEFGSGPGRLDRGGYEEGVIRGVRYQLL